ncbi:MAG: hypothetical protein JO166_07255 [Deltaproteobacteria bacterium]|nr:hypothetical protein [Deltaproteobacteria bacterium]
MNEAIGNIYVPARLSAEDYPNSMPQELPVETIAVGSGALFVQVTS